MRLPKTLVNLNQISAILFVPLCLVTLSSLAQTPQYTFQFGQFHESINFENPGYSEPNSRFSAVATNFNYTGVFNEIRAYLIQSQFRLHRSRLNHQIDGGFNFLNEQEGPPINRGRYHGHITYILPINPELSVGAGVALGWASYNIRGASVAARGNDQQIDGNIGLWLRTSNLQLGAAIDQLFEQQLNPIHESFKLRRYPIVHGAYKNQMTPNLMLRTFGRLRYLKKDLHNLDLSANTLYKDILVTGLGYRSIKALFFYVGMESVALGKWLLQMNVGYQYTLVKSTTTRANAFEILIKINLPNPSLPLLEEVPSQE